MFFYFFRSILTAMSHIQDFGDPTTSPERDAAPRKRDEGCE